MRTGAGNTWNEARVRSACQYQQLPAFDPVNCDRTEVTLKEAAQRLNVSLTVARRLIAEKKLPARQVVACAPWQIPVSALNSEAVRKEAENIAKESAAREFRIAKDSKHCFQRFSEV